MNAFENQQGDARQTPEGATDPLPSLFRKRYRQLQPDELALHDAIKGKADELAQLFAQIPLHQLRPGMALLDQLAVNNGANVTLALRHLEDAVYRAVKALTT